MSMRPAVLVAFLSLFIVAATANSPQCACPPGAKDCGCCEQVVLKFPYIHKTFNETVCANVSWDGNSLSVDLFITIGGKVVISKNVSASSSICYGLPYGAEICAGVENLYINQANGTVSGCLDLSAVILGVTVFDWKLGCFNIHVPKVGKVSAVVKRSTEMDTCNGGQSQCCLYKDDNGRIFYDVYRGPAVCPALYAGKYQVCKERCAEGNGGVEDCQSFTC